MAGYADFSTPGQEWWRPKTQINTQALTTTAPAPAATKQFNEAIALYAPGGGLDAGIKAQLERERAKFLSAGMQGLVSSGLANTTMPAGLAGKFSEEVATPALAGAESQRIQALANLKSAYASLSQGAQESGLSRSMNLMPSNNITTATPSLSNAAQSQSQVGAFAGTPNADAQNKYLTEFNATHGLKNLYQNMKDQATPKLFK